MIVPDASAVVEMLIDGSAADTIRSELAAHFDSLVVPHLLDIEVASALRKLVAAQRIDAYRVAEYLEELAEFPADRHEHEPLLPRIWELRHTFTCYDAAYIALAEAMDAVIYTCDAKLAKGHRARVKVFNVKPH